MALTLLVTTTISDYIFPSNIPQTPSPHDTAVPPTPFDFVPISEAALLAYEEKNGKEFPFNDPTAEI
jgi:hypothetical protein